MKKVHSITLFPALLPLLLLTSCGGGKGDKQAVVTVQDPLVAVETVAVETVDQEEVYTSTVEAFVKNNIAPQSALRIKSLLVEVGDFVKEGQVVAKMDVVSLEQTRLQLANDSTEFARLKALYDAGGLSQSDLETARLGYEVRRKNFQNMQENTILRSPVEGVISARNYDAGDMFTMGKPLYTVEQIVPVKLLVSVSESLYTRVKKGDGVSITADAFPGAVFNGSITRLYPTVDAATHTFKVEVAVPNRYRSLRPGMFVRVKMSFGSRRSVVVPDRAVVKQQGSGDRFVYVYHPGEGTVSYNRVEIGRRLSDRYEILSGVSAGAQVVTEGQLHIKDGVKVQLKESK